MSNPFIVKVKSSQQTLEEVIVSGLTSIRTRERPNSRFYSSDAGHCPVKNVRAATDVGQAVFTAASTLYTEIGNKVHEEVIKSLDKEGLLIFDEYKLPDLGVKLGSKVDAIIFWESKFYGLEIKTCGELPGSIKPEHKAQAALYSFITGLPFIVVYLSRNVADWQGQVKIKSFFLEYDDEYIQTTLKNVITASLSLDKGLIPPIPIGFERNKFPCGQCNYNFACYNGMIPNGLREMTTEEYFEVANEAERIFVELSDNKKNRRNGIIKHIQKNTDKEHIKQALAGEWDKFLI